eukprot:3958187-Pyramimonas_sp.AAC.1
METFGGAPYGDTNRVRGVPTWSGGTHAKRRFRDRQRSSVWGHETCEGCVLNRWRDACEGCKWDLRWSSMWGHETYEGCADTVDMRRAE